MKIEKPNHKEGCMCDPCIAFRVAKKVSERALDESQRAYEQRRGAKIGTISVADALKSRR